MEIALDRRGALVDQFDTAWSIGGERLTGLTDREYRWELIPGMWSVRRRSPTGKSVPGQAAGTAEFSSVHPFGPGEWLLDGNDPDDTPDPAPLTTIAWRIGHLTSGIAGRWEYAFGDSKDDSRHPRDPRELVDFSPSAHIALATLADWMDAWRDGLLSLSEEDLDEPGFCRYPFGFDRDIPFVGVVWWVNREIIHHLAEAALLRDLYLRLG